MRGIQIIDSVSLGRPRPTARALDEALSPLPRDEVIARALQITAAHALDKDTRYQRVHQWFLDWLGPELSQPLEAVQPIRTGLVVRFVDPWQQLVLLRRATEVSPQQGQIRLGSPEGRRLYFEACLAATDLSIPPDPPLSNDPVVAALQAAAHFLPRMWLLNPPNLNNAVARLILFLEELPQAFPPIRPDAETLRRRFTEVLGLPFGEVLALTAFLGYWSIAPSFEVCLAHPESLWIDPQTWLVNTTVPPEMLERLLSRIAVPLEQLPQHLASTTQGSPWLDPLPFRDRPLIRYPDGRVAVTMPELLMEKAGFDIFWWLTEGPGGTRQVRTWQQAFGRLCECYVLGILAEIAEATGANYRPNVTWEGGELDALMWGEDRLAVFEVSGGFLPHASRVSGQWNSLRDALRQRFVERQTTQGSELEAVGQLARDIRWITAARMSRMDTSVPLASFSVIHPVLIAADRTLRSQGIWKYLNQELRERLPDSMPWQVAPLVVAGLEDLEWIQEAIRQRHPRFLPSPPALIQVLLWWEFDHRTHPAFWQLLDDYLGEDLQNSRLAEVFGRWRHEIEDRFAAPA